jgi:hypothetical protein
VRPSEPEKSSWTSAQTSFHERAKNGFPDLEIFPFVFGEAAQDFLSTIPVKADDQVDASQAEPFVFFDLDVFSIEENGEHVWVDRSGVDELQFFDEACGNGVEVFGAGAKAHLVENGFRGIDRACAGEHAEENGLHLIGVSSFVRRRDGRRSEVPGAGSWHPNVDGDRAHIH